MALSLQQKVITLNFMAILAALVLAGVGYQMGEALKATERFRTIHNATRAQMQLDMMHDAIRSDVLQGRTASSQHANEILAQARQSLAERVEASQEFIAQLQAIPMPEKNTALMATVPASFSRYTELATATLGEEGLADPAAFDRQFSVLEQTLGDLGSLIDDWSEETIHTELATARRLQQEFLIVFVIAFVVMSGKLLYLRFAMFRPLRRLTVDAGQLACEQYDIAVSSVGRKDEIGELANALDQLRGKAKESFRLKRMVDDMPINIITADPKNDFRINYANNTSRKTLQQLQQHIAVNAGDIEGHSIDIFHKDPSRVRQMLTDPRNLPHHAKIHVGPEVLDLRVSSMLAKNGDYEGVMLSWSIVTQNVKMADDFESSVGAVSEQISSSAISLQQRSTTLQSAIEELSASAQEISKRVHESLTIVRDAVARGNDASTHTTRLSECAEKVTSVVTLIRSIAEKTNLLALNATIESARAGEAGKGFAVVANEVKALASQTATAITEITAQINAMQSSATDTSSAITQMCEIISSVNKVSTGIASTVEQQQAATSEIARNISGNTGNGMADLRAAGTIMGMATQLTDVSGALREQCTIFLEKMRKM